MQVLVEVEQFVQRDADCDERPEPGHWGTTDNDS
jgi:hypothetical protein